MGLLQTAKGISDSKIEQDLKNRIQDILRCYRNFWDPYGELLQNSVDSINRRYRIYNDEQFYLYNQVRQERNIDIDSDESYRGKILIEIWPHEKKITIKDNGTGIENEKIEKIILPEGTDKKRGKEYGYKGKGLTYAAFISNSFQLSTRYFLEDVTYGIELDGLFNWIADEEQRYEFPNTPVPDTTVLDEEMDKYNTKITLTLDSDYTQKFSAISSVDNAFDLLASKKLVESFCILLRTKTAIGNTKYLFNKQPIVPIDIQLKIYGEDTTIYNEQVPYKYYHPKDHKDIKYLAYEFSNYVLVEKSKAGFDGKFYALSYAKNDQKIGLRAPYINADLHLTAISSSRLSSLNETLELDQELRDAGFSYGVHLSIDGMPTGIRIDDWDNKGATNRRYFVIADCDLSIGEELDAGRKGISYTRAQQISNQALEMRHEQVKDKEGKSVGDKFNAYASKELLIGEPPIIGLGLGESETDDFEERVKQSKLDVAEDKNMYPDRLEFVRKNSSLMRLPRNEEEVRTLFHELLAKNIIKGYKTIYDASSRAEYDAALGYQLELVEENIEPNDILGIAQRHANPLIRKKVEYLKYENVYRDLKLTEFGLCTEFKFSLDNLMYDITRADTSKCSKKLDLVIVWDHNISSTYSEYYTISPILMGSRIWHGSTHRLSILSPEATNIICISLSNIIDQLLQQSANCIE